MTETWAFVDVLRASSSLDVLVETDRHPEVLAQLLRDVPHASGNLLHDAHTVALMQEHGASASIPGTRTSTVSPEPIEVFSEWREKTFDLCAKYRARSRRPEDDFVVRQTRMTMTGFGRFELAYFRHTYMRDQPLLARELLTPSGSVFVQIGR